MYIFKQHVLLSVGILICTLPSINTCACVAVRGLNQMATRCVRCDCSKLMGINKVSVNFYCVRRGHTQYTEWRRGAVVGLGSRWSVVSAWAAATKGMFALNAHSPNLDPIWTHHNKLPQVVSIWIELDRAIALCAWGTKRVWHSRSSWLPTVSMLIWVPRCVQRVCLSRK